MSKSNVRINDLARELEIKSRRVLEFLHERGDQSYTHTSWVNSSLAGELRAEFSDPPGKSEREIRIEQGIILPRAGGEPGAAPKPASTQAPHQSSTKKKNTAKKWQCHNCYAYVPKTEFEAHILGTSAKGSMPPRGRRPPRRFSLVRRGSLPNYRASSYFLPCRNSHLRFLTRSCASRVAYWCIRPRWSSTCETIVLTQNFLISKQRSSPS